MKETERCFHKKGRARILFAHHVLSRCTLFVEVPASGKVNRNEYVSVLQSTVDPQRAQKGHFMFFTHSAIDDGNPFHILDSLFMIE